MNLPIRILRGDPTHPECRRVTPELIPWMRKTAAAYNKYSVAVSMQALVELLPSTTKSLFVAPSHFRRNCDKEILAILRVEAGRAPACPLGHVSISLGACTAAEPNDSFEALRKVLRDVWF